MASPIVGSAFGPLGGDSTEVDIELRPGARVAVGSAGAQIAQPGAHSAVSRANVTLRVGAEARLTWCPEPLIVTAGAEHVATLTVEAAVGSRVLVGETIALSGGRVRSSWRIGYDDVPLYAADLDVGPGAAPGWDGPAGTGGARIVVTAVLAGGQLTPGPFHGGEVFGLAGPGVSLLWLGEDAVQARRCLRAFVSAAEESLAHHG